MLTLQNLSAVLSSGFRLREVTFSVGETERVAVLGPNGSGKSFLLRLILGLETPVSGSIGWGEQVLSSAKRVVVPPQARAMGIVFQEGAIFPHLDVRKNVALAVPRGTKRADRDPQVERALELARIRSLHDRAVQSLSGGEQQRVAIARALVHRPRLLLLDEPFHSLDGPLKREILSDVRELVARERIATILVTHDTDEAASFAERVLLLREGRVVQQGTFEDIYSNPRDREAADFLGPVETLDRALARESCVEVPEQGEGASLCFRREHVELRDLDDEAMKGVEITDVKAHGVFQDVSIKLADGSELVSRELAGPSRRAGQLVRARIISAFEWQDTEEDRA